MPSSSRLSETPHTAARLLWSSVACAVALALAFGAAHWYELPDTKGSTGRSAWTEPDVLCAVASSAIALAVGLSSRRAALALGATAARSLAARAAIWAAFTLFFGLVWLDSVFLFTLLIAPTHAFASLRVLGLWSRWRAEVTWSRRD